MRVTVAEQLTAPVLSVFFEVRGGGPPSANRVVMSRHSLRRPYASIEFKHEKPPEPPLGEPSSISTARSC